MVMALRGSSAGHSSRSESSRDGEEPVLDGQADEGGGEGLGHRPRVEDVVGAERRVVGLEDDLAALHHHDGGHLAVAGVVAGGERRLGRGLEDLQPGGIDEVALGPLVGRERDALGLGRVALGHHGLAASPSPGSAPSSAVVVVSSFETSSASATSSSPEHAVMASRPARSGATTRRGRWERAGTAPL